MEALSVKDLWVSYSGGDWVLKGVTITVGEGLTLLAGGTGSGKSTLLRAIAGVAEKLYGANVKGHVKVNGRTLLVPQETDLFLLMPRVADELAYLESLSGGRLTAKRLAELVGLEGKEDLRVSQLSAGGKQRLALASVFAVNADIVLLDEPLAYLDYWMAREFVSFLNKLARNRIVIVAEHRLWFFRELGPDVIVIDNGMIVYKGDFNSACNSGFEKLDFGRGCGNG